GRFGSEGTFVMQRKPDHRTTKGGGPDESTDSYDTIDWMIHNIPNNNGRVGMLGISYDGWTTAEALIDAHPALRAASPQASPDDMFLNDDFHHQGAFRFSYGFEYAVLTEASDTNSNFDFGRYDTYDWYLELGPLSNANDRYLHGKLPSWNNFIAHPNHDTFWTDQAATTYLTRTTVPTLNDGGRGGGRVVIRQLHLRSREPGAVSAAADRAHLLPEGERLVHLAAAGPALRRSSPRRAELGDRTARARRGDPRRHRGAPVRQHDGERRGLDREADRRLSRGLLQPQHDGRLSAHGRERRAAGPVSHRVRAAASDCAESRARVRRGSPQPGLPL